VSQLLLQASEWTWANCNLIIGWHRNSEPGSFAVSVSYQQINSHCAVKLINRNLAANFRFSRKFCFLVPISRGKYPFCPHPADSHGFSDDKPRKHKRLADPLLQSVIVNRNNRVYCAINNIVFDQWFSTFLHQRTGKKAEKFYGPLTKNCTEYNRLSQPLC